MKKRNLIVCILLAIITCGIYGIYWFVVVTTASNKMVEKNKTANGGMAFLFGIITAGIYLFYWAYKMSAKRGEALGIKSNPIGCLLLTFIFGTLAGLWTGQSTINEYLDKHPEAPAPKAE